MLRHGFLRKIDAVVMIVRTDALQRCLIRRPERRAKTPDYTQELRKRAGPNSRKSSHETSASAVLGAHEFVPTIRAQIHATAAAPRRYIGDAVA
jgi:hypothetical protein